MDFAMNLHPFFNFFIRSFILRTCSIYLIRINLYLDMVINFWGTEEPHTQRFGICVSSRRCPSSFYESYTPRAPSRPSVSPCRMGGTSASTSLRSELAQVSILSQHETSEHYVCQVNLSVCRNMSIELLTIA